MILSSSQVENFNFHFTDKETGAQNSEMTWSEFLELVNGELRHSRLGFAMCTVIFLQGS